MHASPHMLCLDGYKIRLKWCRAPGGPPAVVLLPWVDARITKITETSCRRLWLAIDVPAMAHVPKPQNDLAICILCKLCKGVISLSHTWKYPHPWGMHIFELVFSATPSMQGLWYWTEILFHAKLCKKFARYTRIDSATPTPHSMDHTCGLAHSMEHGKSHFLHAPHLVATGFVLSANEALTSPTDNKRWKLMVMPRTEAETDSMIPFQNQCLLWSFTSQGFLGFIK